MLSVLALKMIHTEEFDEVDYIYQANANVYWREIKETDLPFHRWYRWLEDKFMDLRNIQLEHKSGSSSARKLSMTVDEEKKMNTSGKDKSGKGFWSRLLKKDKKDKKDRQGKTEDDIAKKEKNGGSEIDDNPYGGRVRTMTVANAKAENLV